MQRTIPLMQKVSVVEQQHQEQQVSVALRGQQTPSTAVASARRGPGDVDDAHMASAATKAPRPRGAAAGADEDEIAGASAVWAEVWEAAAAARKQAAEGFTKLSKQAQLIEEADLGLQETANSGGGLMRAATTHVADFSPVWLAVVFLILAVLTSLALLPTFTTGPRGTQESPPSLNVEDRRTKRASTPALASSLLPSRKSLVSTSRSSLPAPLGAAPSARSMRCEDGTVASTVPRLCPGLVVPEGDECMLKFPVWRASNPICESIDITDMHNHCIFRMQMCCGREAPAEGRSARGRPSWEPPADAHGLSLRLFLATDEEYVLMASYQQTTPGKFEFRCSAGELFATLTQEGSTSFRCNLQLVQTGQQVLFWGSEQSMMVTGADARLLAKTDKANGGFYACFAPDGDVGMLLGGFICAEALAHERAG